MNQDQLARLQDFIDGIDELRAELEMDSAQAEQLQDAYYLLIDAREGVAK